MSLIAPGDHLILFTIITGAAALGMWSEHKKWFGKVSGILVTVLLMSLLSMTGIVPPASSTKVHVPVYDLIFTYFVPLSIPMMLLGSNIMRTIREGGKLLIAYIIGAIGVVLGSFLAFSLIHLGPDSGDMAGVIASTLIGGSMNFVATGKALHITTLPLFSTTIAVDNFAASFYILLLFMLPGIKILARLFAKPKAENKIEAVVQEHQKSQPITMERIGLTLVIAAAIAASGAWLGDWLKTVIHTQMDLSILIITLISVLVANLFPKRLKPLEDTAFSVGLWMMYIFLAAIGAATNMADILHIGPAILGFYLIILFFHLFFLIALAKLFKLDIYEVMVSSAANVMGPSVAAPMAASLGQKKLITPGILVGILGYVIGTFIGVSIALVLS